MLPARAFRQTTFNTVNSLRQLTKNHHVLFRQPFTKRSLQTSNLNLCSLPPRRFSRSAPKRQLSEGPPAQPNYNPTPNLNSPEASLTLTQRMRKLSREYGWSAVGVYFLLTALDFPICFIAVRSLGTERIGGWEHKIIEWVKRAIPLQIPARWRGIEAGVEEAQDALGGNVPGYDHGVKAAERANAGESASKSLIAIVDVLSTLGS